MGMSPPASIHTNPVEAPRQNADESTPHSIAGLAKSAIEQVPASAASLADRAVEPIDQQNKELAKRISENHLALRNYSSAELDAIAPYLTYADCTELGLSDEQLQNFIRKLTNVEELIIHNVRITNLTVPRNVKKLDCYSCDHLSGIHFVDNSQLQQLDCMDTTVTSLNVPATVTQLYCSNNAYLTSIYFAVDSQLQVLDCSYTDIISLNVPATVTRLECHDCSNLANIQFADNSQIQKFDCSKTNITSLNVPATMTQLEGRGCSNLTNIQFAANSQIQQLDCSKTNITSLNVPATVMALTLRECSRLASIQFADNSQLQSLICCDLDITSLNVPATVTQLTCATCASLVSMHFADNAQLQTLNCMRIGITSLNVPVAVTTLCCSYCSHLTDIQFTENAQLQTLMCMSCPVLNNIQCEALPHCNELHYLDCPNLRQLPQLPPTTQVLSGPLPSQSGRDILSQSVNHMLVDAEVLNQNTLAVLLDLGYNYLLQGKFFPSIVFVDSATGVPAGIDLGGLRRHVVATIFKNLIDNEEMFARYEDTGEARIRLPRLMPNADEDMRTAMRTIGHLFALCYTSDTIRTGVYFEPKLFTTILWLMNEENLRLSNLDERIFALLRGWDYDTLADEPKQAIPDYIRDCDIVSPVRLIAEQMRRVLPPGWQVSVTPEYLQRKIQGLRNYNGRC